MPESHDAALSSGIGSSLLLNLFPEPNLCRSLLKSVGAAALLGALSALLPIDALKAIAAGEPTRVLGGRSTSQRCKAM